MGLLGLVLSAPGALAALTWLLVPAYDSSGLDFEVASPSPWLSVLAVALAVATVIVFGLTVFWSRRRWAGYALLGIGLSLVIGIVGLLFQGIL